jgi:hypothetical protein
MAARICDDQAAKKKRKKMLMHNTQTSPPKQARAKVIDQDLGQVGNIPVLVPDADYQMGFVRVERGHVMNRERWFLYFRIITPGNYFGTEMFLACPCPANGKFGLSSKLVAAATVALGQRPKRRDRLNTRIFAGKVFSARTRTVTRDHKDRPRPPVDHYSVIDELLALEAGATGRRT